MSEPLRQFFGDVEHAFRLDPAMILELERVVGAGIGGLSRRFFAGDFRFAELTEVLRLALIGGGIDPQEAKALVDAYAGRMSVTALYAVALPVIETVMFGSVQIIARNNKRRAKKETAE